MSSTIILRQLPFRLNAIIPLILISFFLISGIPLRGHSVEVNQEVKAGQEVKTDQEVKAGQQVKTGQELHEELTRGERFFKGMLPVNRKFKACESCHNIQHSDTMNWNPSAMDIALKYKDKDFAVFQSVLMQPDGIKMAEVHKDFEIEENDLKTVKAYLDNMATMGPPAVGPIVTQKLIFAGLIILLLLALVDLLFFHVIKFRTVHALILFITLGLLTKMIASAAIDLGRTKNYAPDQPIKFSHKIHAGANRIDCKYCHNTAEYEKSSGIPPMQLCMNCHVLVREGSHSGKFEISKVIESYEKNKPVEWIRIHNLPAHVFFSHAQHVGIAKVDCKKCHGPVAEMNIMRQYSDLSMGWCINCHRQTKVNFKDNAYYDNYKDLHTMLKSGKIDTVRAVNIGANNCMRCHY